MHALLYIFLSSESSQFGSVMHKLRWQFLHQHITASTHQSVILVFAWSFFLPQILIEDETAAFFHNGRRIFNSKILPSISEYVIPIALKKSSGMKPCTSNNYGHCDRTQWPLILIALLFLRICICSLNVFWSNRLSLLLHVHNKDAEGAVATHLPFASSLLHVHSPDP